MRGSREEDGGRLEPRLHLSGTKPGNRHLLGLCLVSPIPHQQDSLAHRTFTSVSDDSPHVLQPEGAGEAGFSGESALSCFSHEQTGNSGWKTKAEVLLDPPVFVSGASGDT